MVWLVASKDGEDAGAALAYVGWHSKPGTGHGEVFVLPEHRGAGVGSALYDARRGVGAGAGLRHARDRRGRGRPREPRVGRPPRLPRGRAELEDGARPDRRSRLRRSTRRKASRSSPGPSGPSSPRALYAVACEAYPDVPGDEETQMDLVRGVARERHARRRATGPTRRSSRWSTARSPATPSSRSRRRTRRSPTTT